MVHVVGDERSLAALAYYRFAQERAATTTIGSKYYQIRVSPAPLSHTRIGKAVYDHFSN